MRLNAREGQGQTCSARVCSCWICAPTAQGGRNAMCGCLPRRWTQLQKYPTCASRHNHTRRTVWLRHNPLLRRKLFRVFGSMSAPSEGPQAKSLPSPASACATTGLWLKGQSLALRRWWPLHDMHPAWFAGRRFLVARLTGAARSVCSGRFGRVATKMVPQGRCWAGASDEKRCVRSMGSLGSVECGLGAGLDCGGWHHGLVLPSPE